MQTIRPWWLVVAFLAGLAVALGTGELLLSLRDNNLELSAPRVHFLTGTPLARLHNAAEVPFAVQVTLFSGRPDHVYKRSQERCVFSFDLWEEKFSVAKLEPPRRRTSHLSEQDAEKWCLSTLLTIDVTGVRDTEPLWARLDIRAEDPPRNGSLLAGSVSESGVSLTNGLTSLVELFSRPPQLAQPHWPLSSEKFTLAELRKGGRGA
jgi:hypothetical protein